MTPREWLRMVLGSDPHREWAARHATDARKIEDEFRGQHRPQPASAYGKGLVGLCRAHPAVAAPPPTPVLLLAQPGALLRNPRGGVEDMARFYQAGGRWVAANLGDHSMIEWQLVRYKAQQANVKFGYWMRCRTPEQITSLLNWSVGMDLCLVNVEQPEVEEGPLTPDVVAATIRAAPSVPNTGTVLQGWIGWVADGKHYGPNYAPLAGWPALLEVFPTDMQRLPDGLWNDCREHATRLGLRDLVQLVQTYGAAKPSWYQPPYSLYTLDDAVGENGPIEDWL